MQQEISYGQIVGQVMRGCREMQGINLLAMAESVALATPSGWSRVETGDTAMTLIQLRKAARKLGMEPAAVVRQADVIASQLEASGVVVHDEKPKNLGKWLLGGAGLLALVAAGAAAAAAKAAEKDDETDEGDKTEETPK
jgi:hypothetical protein